MSRRIAWALAILSLVCAVADTVVDAAVQPLFSRESLTVHGWPLVTGAALGSALLGAVIVTRYPRHLVGWLLCVIGATSSISLLAEIWSIWVVNEGGPGPFWTGELTGEVSTVIGGPFAITGVTLMFLLVPDGRLLSPRWRGLAIASVAALAIFIIGVLLVPPNEVAGRSDPKNTHGIAVLVISTGFLVTTAALLGSVVCMVLRLRQARGEVRQQLRWIVVSACFLGVGLITLLIGQAITGNQETWSTSVPLYVGYFLLPIAIAVSVLRYRLYDIDLIINRAVLLGLGTLFAAIGYIAIVVAVGAALGGHAAGFWPSLVATAVVALAFQPVRRWVVRLADRLAYGPRAIPYETLSTFSRLVGERADPADLLSTVAEAAGLAVRATSASVRLDLAAGDARTASWAPKTPPAAASAPLVRSAEIVVPVEDHLGALGSITVTTGAGRPARSHDLRLLADIAEHAALAFRNSRLEAELAAHVATLDRSNAELVASRRRLVEAGDEGRRRLERSIGRDVLPILTGIRRSLAEWSTTGGAAATPEAIGGGVDEATRALEALRELTRGVFPTMLARAGLGPALVSYYTRLGRSDALQVDASVTGRRFSERVEMTAYFCCTESVPRGPDAGRVAVSVVAGALQILVRGSRLEPATLQAVTDRVESLGGGITLEADPGQEGRVDLVVRLPVELDARHRDRSPQPIPG